MIEEYQPSQEHKSDPCYKPFENSGGRGRRPNDDDEDDYDRPGQSKPEVKLDTVIKHKTPGSDLVIYCLPRPNICQSRRCIDLINYFGNLSGF